MKFGELLDSYRKYEIYEYGDNQQVKLYKDSVNRSMIEEEYQLSKVIQDKFSLVVEIKDLVEVEDRLGIVIDKSEAESLLFKLENDPLKLEALGKTFAEVHVALHQTTGLDIRSQETFFLDHINKCQYLSQDVKENLIAGLKDLPDGQNLCHGNYHLNNVLINDHYHVMDFDKAYKGHPMSDVAKACIILDVPRQLDGATHFFNEELIKLKQKMMQVYLDSYKSLATYDEDILAQFLRYAAVVRLNENIEIEREWLLNIITN